jgi:hypothetical protein
VQSANKDEVWWPTSRLLDVLSSHTSASTPTQPVVSALNSGTLC